MFYYIKNKCYICTLMYNYKLFCQKIYNYYD